MLRTTKTDHTWTLEESERFSWTKRNYAHAGHAFTVHVVSLEHRDGDTTVYLRGPWSDGFAPKAKDGSSHQGWEFLYAAQPDDAIRILELPLEVRTALAEFGLQFPATDARGTEPGFPVYEEERDDDGILISRRLVNP